MRSNCLRGACVGLLGSLLLGCGNSAGDNSGPGPNNGGASGASGASGSGGDATGNAGSSAGGGGLASAGIQMRLGTPAAPTQGADNHLLAFAGGGAVRPGLASLEYFILSVQICESMDAQGSGFSNPAGCLELYSGDRSALPYELDGDWTSLAARARDIDDGFVDLLNADSREALAGTTALTSEHVRSYHYGIITWALPIKVKATLALGDGSFLYTHDGETTFETIGADNYRAYFTSPAAPLDTPPAEKAVVLLGNGGNWFKFQNPLTITQADIDEQRQWVLDLVFNPEGIVKGFTGDGAAFGNLRERSGEGMTTRSISVPLLDLAPIPHRQNQQVVRESYLASLSLGSQAFDLRLELYSVDGDPNGTIYGVDAKTLVTAASTRAPAEMSKISYVVPEADGSLSFQSFTQSSIISGFRRVVDEVGSTTASIKCATHADRVGAEGGAAIVLDSCPSPELDVTFRLVGRSLLDGELPSGGGAVDAGADAQPASNAGDAGPDASPDAGL